MTTRTNVQKLTMPLYRFYQGACGTATFEQLPLYSTVDLTDTVTYGPNIPNYKRCIIRGIDCTSNADGIRKQLKEYSEGDFHIYPKCPGWTGGNTGFTGWFEHVSMPTSVSDVSTLVADAKAKQYFLQNAIAAQRNFMGGVALGELRETLRMIRNPARAISSSTRDYLRAVKKRRKSTLPKHRKRLLQDSWLEYSFGWIPLLNDIQNGLKALNTFHDVQLQRIVGTWSDKSVVLGSLFNRSSGRGLLHYYHRQATEREAVVIYRGAVRSQASNPIKSEITKWGFDPRDFIPTAWELVPYSFLVDYFSNIGDVIEGWSWQDLGVSWCNRTVVQEKTQKILEMYPDAAYLATKSSLISGHSFSPQRTAVSYKTFTRSRYTGGFIPDVTFQLPGIGSLKWVNIGALIRFESRGLRPFF